MLMSSTCRMCWSECCQSCALMTGANEMAEASKSEHDFPRMLESMKNLRTSVKAKLLRFREAGINCFLAASEYFSESRLKMRAHRVRLSEERQTRTEYWRMASSYSHQLL